MGADRARMPAHAPQSATAASRLAPPGMRHTRGIGSVLAVTTELAADAPGPGEPCLFLPC